MVYLNEIEELCKGRTYHDKQQVKDSILKYHSQKGKTFKVKCTGPNSIYFWCTEEDCQFKAGFRRTRKEVLYRTTQIIQHTCLGGQLTMPGTWLSEKSEIVIKSSPNYKPLDLINYANSVFGAKVSHHKSRRVINSIKNDPMLSSDVINYGLLKNYLEWTKKNNPNCTVEYEYNDTVFTKCFVSFECSTIFLENSEKILFVDGCHTKGDYKGVILTCVASDSMGQIFPIAYGLVPTENEESWLYFFQNLNSHLGFDDIGNKLRFMSDRKPGLLNARIECFPNAIHIYCAVHLEMNIR